MKEMNPHPSPLKTFNSNLFRPVAIIFSICILIYFSISLTLIRNNSEIRSFLLSSSRLSQPVPLDHIVFGIASSKASWPKHKEYIKIWWKPEQMKGCVFVDSLPSENHDPGDTSAFPPIYVSQNTSHFRYTHRHGYHSFIRVARVVSETVNLNHQGVQWYVFGDGDTVFFTDNLVKTLSKYDSELWYYIGANSEIYEQNSVNSFEMGFWSAGFALSSSLARVLSKVFDSCLQRYPHVYGSDGRIYSCLAELGVGLTREPGFHQVDVRGNIFGLLAAHPLTPLLSLAHLGEVDPIFPSMSELDALDHLFKAARTDPERILQQTVCYDRWFSWTISVSWGYAVEIFNQHINLPNVLRVQDTFSPWRKGGASNYAFCTRPLHPDPCKRSTIFYFDRAYVTSKSTTIKTEYRRILPDNCTFDPMASSKKLEEVVVFSRKSNLDLSQLWAPRRQCCDVLPSSDSSKLELSIRECRVDELIRIHA